MNSAEEAGGTAYGVTGTIVLKGPDDLKRLGSVLEDIGEWVRSQAGMFLGHVKSSLDQGDGKMTLNLTDLKIGTEYHGIIQFPATAVMKFMAAVLDMDHKRLEETVLTKLRAIGFKPENDKIIKLG